MSHKLKSIPSKEVKTNMIQGSYRPRFFDNPKFIISSADFESEFFEEGNPELSLLKQDFSFAYLREDKLRTINVVDNDNKKVTFNNFLDCFNIKINSSNLFKSGKYLSRVFRPTKYGGFYSNLSIHINNNIPVSKVDGLSLISVELARSLGYKEAQPNQSAQFTLFYKEGLVKGHCVFSDTIDYDVIIYGKDNIKDEIKFNSEEFYLAIEPVKLSDTLRIDIQSLLNLWELFGQEQLFVWAADGIENFKRDLYNGTLNRWLDNFNSIDPEDYEKENWTLRKAVWHKLDCRDYPGLIRQAWSLFRSSLINMGENSKGIPSFRIPVPGGMRGYFRVDLREHDKEGSFSLKSKKRDVELDLHGNIWINPEIIEPFLEIKGGADLDDSAGIIPIENNRVIIYRNPNQYGEYGIHTITYLDDLEPTTLNTLNGTIPLKKIADKKSIEEIQTGNKLFDKYLSHQKVVEDKSVSYTIDNLLKSYTLISKNSTNIGTAANAEMQRSAVGIIDKQLMKQLLFKYSWNLERVIDSTVKEGVNSSEDIDAVESMYEKIISCKIPVANSLVHRFPKSLRKELTISKEHPLDELLEAIKLIIQHTNREILGEGSVSKGNRIKGYIDKIDIPISKIGLANIDNPMTEISEELLRKYNMSMAIMLDKTNSTKEFDREKIRKSEIEKIRKELADEFNLFNQSEKEEITKHWAYQIYKSEKAVHDSILWIDEIADYTIKMFANIGMAHHIRSNGSIERYKERRSRMQEITSIRIWSNKEIREEDYLNSDVVLILDKNVLMGDMELNLGDECRINEGEYKIKRITRSRSKKTMKPLRNSLTLFLS